MIPGLSIPITIDLQNPYSNSIQLVQNEMAGRRLQFKIVSDGLVVNLTGKTVLLTGKKSDGTVVMIQLTISAATMGEAYCEVTSQLVAAGGNVDLQIQIYSPAVTGTATSATTTSMYDTSKAWTVNEHAGRWLYIGAGTGAGQSRRIVSNTATQIVVSEAWDSNPAAGSAYAIISEVGSSFVFTAIVWPSNNVEAAVVSSNDFSALQAAIATAAGLTGRVGTLETADTQNVKLSGNQTIAGNKTFSGTITFQNDPILPNPSWIDATTSGTYRLLGTWAGHVYYKKVGNRVYVAIDGLTNPSAVGTPAYNFPAGLRPGKSAIDSFSGRSSGAATRAVVTSAGDLYIQSPTGGYNTAGELYDQYFEYLAEG